jgi:hypothetical protein
MASSIGTVKKTAAEYKKRAERASRFTDDSPSPTPSPTTTTTVCYSTIPPYHHIITPSSIVTTTSLVAYFLLPFVDG